MKIVLIEPLSVDLAVIERLARPWRAAGHSFVAYDSRAEDPAELRRRAGDADIVLEGNQPLPAEMLRQLSACRYLSVGFSGIDHVDAETARQMGITVSNSAGYADDSVAELALGMMLSLLRNIGSADAACKAGRTKDGLVGRELRGKTVGIVGMGACGCRLAEILQVFGCRVIFYAPRPSERAMQLGLQVELPALFREADIISLHCPLTEQTRGLVGKDLLGQMKPSAILINTARGPIVDSAALAEALNSGRIAGAGVDVYETEPPISPEHPLLQARNCLTTPHVAFASAESMVKRAEIAFGNVDAYLAGKPRNVKIAASR